MNIKFYGVRGSYAVPGGSTVKYGGNTTCVTFTNEVDGKIDRVIIDCGTGATQLGKDIISKHFVGKEDLNIMMLFTHLHPDHTQGFPFFAPNYFPNCRMDLYGMETLKMNVGKILDKSMLPPTFPIEYKDLKSKRKHHTLKDGDMIHSPLGSMRVEVTQAYAPSHPQQGALYFKITEINRDNTGKTLNEKSVACIWDCESKAGGDKAVINFAKDCDIMIHDTQYTKEEYESDKMVVQGFGHSTYEMAIDNAIQAGIKDKLICTHFNPTHTDSKLDDIERELPIEIGPHEAHTILAQEEMEIEV
jgi:phosphoribosyl 1,2-cyclic phosphodiesterase